MARTEHERIESLREILGQPTASALELGIGDDAAVINLPQGRVVWTVDAAVEDVHFRLDFLGMRALGYRATMAAASDLAAMGASPLSLLSSLILPVGFEDEALFELARGQRDAADQLGISVVGGNLARGPSLSITTTALGTVGTPLTRSGAQAGDELWLAGEVGLAAAGLELLLRGQRESSSAASKLALEAFRAPRARIAEGLAVQGKATAAIDVSDGLAQDVGHVLKASGTSALLWAAALVSPALEAIAEELGHDALKFALFGGEDYALLVSVPSTSSGALGPEWVRIGSVTEGSADGPRLVVELRSGEVEPVPFGGWDHFRSAP